MRGVKSASGSRSPLTDCMSEAIKLCETSLIKIPTLCQGLHTSTSLQAKEVGNTSWFESFYCIQYCMQIYICETKHFLSALPPSSLSLWWWGAGVAIAVHNAG